MAKDGNMRVRDSVGRRWPACLAASLLLLSLLMMSAAPLPATAGPATQVARLLFVGDIMLGRHVGELIAIQGTTYPFDAIRSVIEGADLAFGNMESPLTTMPRVVGGYDLRAEPAYAETVALAGFDILSLANNHATDNGRDGLRQSMQTLADLGIGWTGAGETVAEARAPAIRVVNGVRIAYLAYDGTHACSVATSTKAGCNVLNLVGVVADVEAAREAADFVVVSFHWGEEYQPLPNDYQQRVAKRVASAGADLIVGHHPHVVQPVEWVMGDGRDHPTLVAYSLGNFLFDQYFSDETMQSALLSCVITPEGIQAFGLHPVQNHWARTFTADESNGEAVLSRLRAGSSDPGWQVVTSPGAALDPTIWWLDADLVGPADNDLLDFDGDGTPERVILTGTRMLVYSAGNVTLATPNAWFVHGWATLPEKGAGRRLLLSLTEPPAWGGVEPPLAGDRLWRHGGMNSSSDRLYLLRWSGQQWNLIHRSRPLLDPIRALVCGEAEESASTRCILIQDALGGTPLLVERVWNGKGWSQSSAEVGRAYEELGLWDMDGDGRDEILVRVRNE